MMLTSNSSAAPMAVLTILADRILLSPNKLAGRLPTTAPDAVVTARVPVLRVVIFPD
jgi:hypothetical protein